MNKIKQKIISAVAAFSLLVNSFAPVMVSPIYAQEASPSAEVSSEPSPSPEPNPSTTPDLSTSNESTQSATTVEPSPTPTPSPSPTPAPAPLWIQNEDGGYTTGTLQLGVTYYFPPNNKVIVTFTKLPETPGTLTIKQIILSQEDKEDLGAFSDTAYDITSTMEDGTFEYTLTLPAPQTENVEVKVSEDGQNFTDVSGETVQQDTVTITGLTHFTIFVVVGTIEEGDEQSQGIPFDESGSNVLINEFVYNASTEWIELYNRSNQAVDLTGWKLEDGNNITSDDLDLLGTILSGGLLVFQRSQGWLNNTSSNGDGDTIFLKDDEGQIVDQVTYRRDAADTTVVNAQDLGNNPSTGDSIGRQEDGSETWRIFDDGNDEPTKGFNNDAGDTGEITFLNVGSIYPFSSIFEGLNGVDVLNGISSGGTINVRAGNYFEEFAFEIANEGLRIIGPGIGEGIDRAVITVDDCADNFGFNTFFHLHANNIILQGLEIDADNNCDHVIHVGDFSEIQVSGVQVLGNAIHDGIYGVTISWGSSNDEEVPNVVTGNDIYSNNVGVLLNSANNNTISDNTILDNFTAGLWLSDCFRIEETFCGFDGPSNNIISGNTIQTNGALDTGIHIFSNGGGNTANNNVISGNIVGVINDTEEVFDATENFWGDESGPFHEVLNQDGLGNSVSDNVLFRPFFLDELLETLSTNEVDPEDLASLLNTGSFSIPEGQDSSAASEVNVNEEVVINVSEDGGTSSVTLPEGTEITRTGGGTINVGVLSAEDVTESSLAGLGTGVVADGALQWGLDNIELTFNPAITVTVFVGTALNDQTLNVVRSTTGDGGWTNDGIGPPTTCLVTDGLCTFTATKASFYAATHTTPAPSAGTTQALSAASGSAPAPTCSDTKPGSAPTLLSATSAGSNQVTLTWSKAKDPVTYYLVNYSETAGTFQYGNPNVGGSNTTSYTVSGLSGGTTYYFKVRAGNGCAPGDYSNEVSATPGGGFISGPAAGFAPGVLGVTTDEDVDLGEVKGEGTTPTSESTVEPPLSSQPPANLWQLIGNVFSAIFGFFGRLFGR